MPYARQCGSEMTIPPTTKHESIDLGGVRASRDRISQVERGVVTCTVLRADVLDVSIRRGSPSNRPKLQVVFGILLVALGLLPLPGILNWLVNGGVMHAGFVWWLAWAALGIWLIANALSTRTYLLARMQGRVEKFVFDAAVPDAEPEHFVTAICDEFGYSGGSAPDRIQRSGARGSAPN